MANVFAALEATYTYGMDAELVRGVNIFARFLQARGLYAQAEIHLKRAQQSANALLDSLGSATTLFYLGEIAEKRGDYVQAQAYLQEGLALARQAGYREGSIVQLINLGHLACERGDYDQAEGYWQEALDLARQIGHREYISTA